MTHLLVVRHGPVAWEGVCYGQADAPSTLPPHEVADRLAQSALQYRPELIWSSDVSRCAEPAALVAERLQLPHRIDTDVRELSYGAWEGLPWSEIERSEVDHWSEDWLTRAPPGGETVLELALRVERWSLALAHGRHFLLGHAGVIHALRFLSGRYSWPETMERRIDFLAAERFEVSPDWTSNRSTDC